MLLSAITPNKLRKDSRINGLIKIQLCDMPFQNDADWTVNPLGPGTTGGSLLYGKGHTEFTAKSSRQFYLRQKQ